MSLDFNEFTADFPENWRARIEKELKGKPFENLVWKHPAGFEVNPNQSFHKDNEGVPGKFPYLRGVKTESNNWEICQFIAAVDQKTMNAQALEALNGGAEGLVFSLAKNPDLRLLLKGIYLSYIGLRFQGDFTRENFEQLKEFCTANEIAHTAVNGSTELHLYTPKLELRKEQIGLAKDIIETFPSFKPITVRSEFFHDMGAQDALEMACGLSIGYESFIELLNAGVDADRASAALSLTLSAGSSFFTQLAKFRVFRQLWGLVLSKHDFEHSCSTATHLQAFTSKWNKATLDQENNLLRATTEAMSAILGGADSVCVYPYNENTKASSASGMRYARNIQHLLKSESFLHQTTDPAGGSYYIENLTQELREKTWELFCEMQEQGGINEMHKKGEIMKLLKADGEAQKQALHREEKIMIGVNKFRPENKVSAINDSNRLAKEFEV